MVFGFIHIHTGIYMYIKQKTYATNRSPQVNVIISVQCVEVQTVFSYQYT